MNHQPASTGLNSDSRSEHDLEDRFKLFEDRFGSIAHIISKLLTHNLIGILAIGRLASANSISSNDKFLSVWKQTYVDLVSLLIVEVRKISQTRSPLLERIEAIVSRTPKSGTLAIRGDGPSGQQDGGHGSRSPITDIFDQPDEGHHLSGPNSYAHTQIHPTTSELVDGELAGYLTVVSSKAAAQLRLLQDAIRLTNPFVITEILIEICEECTMAFKLASDKLYITERDVEKEEKAEKSQPQQLYWESEPSEEESDEKSEEESEEESDEVPDNFFHSDNTQADRHAEVSNDFNTGLRTP